MGRPVLQWVCVFVLVALPVGGCSDETTATGGTGGDGGSGGMGGADLCEGIECDDFDDCTDDVCDATDSMCDSTPVADGTTCAGGTCQEGACALGGTLLPCTEQGIRNAIAAGGGPYTFDCDGPTTVTTDAEIVIDNDVELDGEGNLTVDGGGEHADQLDDHRVFSVADGVTVELDGLVVTGGVSSFESGGGIYSLGTLTLTNSTVSGNTTRRLGGGIFSSGIATRGGMLTLTNSTVSGNTARHGGGIHNHRTLTLKNSTVSGNTAGGGGGGISNAGTLTLTNSTVSGNTAGDGGGGISNAGPLTLTNSTVSGNTAGDGGGGISNAGGPLTLTNSTVSGNTAPTVGGIETHGREYQGVLILGTLTLSSSTVAGNTQEQGADLGFGPLSGSFSAINSVIAGACSTAATSDGHNIESPGDTCGFDQGSDQVDVSADDLNLGPLQHNGGPTTTHALLPGSSAIDVIPADTCGGDTDQRGEPRPGGTMCDVGAFEVQEGSL